MSATPQKAKITVFRTGGPEEITVMFNPVELSFSEMAEWSGEEASLEFGGTKLQDFTVSLFFDTYEKGTDVRELTEKFSEIIQPTEPGKSTKRPPECLFSWGKFRYKGVVQQVDQKFTMFLSDGTPARAELTVKLKSVLTSQDAAKLRGIEACRKMRTVKEGERLDLIASRELKDPALWRKIAYENDIDDPLNFPTEEDVGRTLIIPD